MTIPEGLPRNLSPKSRRRTQPPPLHADCGHADGRPPLRSSAARSLAAAKELVLVNWGGDALTAYDEAYGQPFKKETGITVKEDGSGPTEGAVAAQFKSGKPSWDLVDADPFSAITARQARA